MATRAEPAALVGGAVCPRCGFRGFSEGYFAQGGHLAILVAMFFLFFPAAIVYLAMRHNHRNCPRCGISWGRDAELAVPAPAPVGPGGHITVHEPAMAGGDGGKIGWSWVFFILAGILALTGIANLAPGLVVMGGLSAGAGFLLRQNAESERKKRRMAILQGLQAPVLQLAARKGGKLTVTEVATEFGWPLPRAEKVLNSLEDGYRVTADITDEGVIVYQFLELLLPEPPPPLPRLDAPPERRAQA